MKDIIYSLGPIPAFLICLFAGVGLLTFITQVIGIAITGWTCILLNGLIGTIMYRHILPHMEIPDSL